jgi:hypothetical protein
VKTISSLSISMFFCLAAITANAASCTKQSDGTIDPSKNCSPVAVCDGSTDDGPTFAAAMSVLNTSGGTLKVPAKTCMVNSTLNITHSNVGIVCTGGNFTCVLETSVASLPQITATTFSPGPSPVGVTDVSLRGLVLTRIVQASVGGDGIDFTGWVNSSDIDSVSVNAGYNDIVLGPCSISRARNLYLANAVFDNLVFTAQAGQNGNTLQWDVDSVSTGGAGRFGVYVTSSGATVSPGVILGDWRNIHAFINGNSAVSVQGTTTEAVNDLRIDKSWFCCSNGGNYEVYVAVNGGINNRLQNSTIEACPAYGIALDGLDADFTISGTKINGCSNSGILSYAQHLVLDGVISNGNTDGVDIFGGMAVISGLWANGNRAWGLNLAGSGAVYGSAGDLSGNTSGAETGATSSNSKLCAIKGVTGLCN